MYDLENAEKVLAMNGEHVGYVFELASDVWLPLNLAGHPYSGPSHHDDAVTIVRLKFANNEPAITEG